MVRLISIVLMFVVTILTPTMIAQQTNGSNYSIINGSNYSMINGSNYSMINGSNSPMINGSDYSVILKSKNGADNQTNKSLNLTASTVSSAGKEFSNPAAQMDDKKNLIAKTVKKQANMEPVLKMILESDYHPHPKS